MLKAMDIARLPEQLEMHDIAPFGNTYAAFAPEAGFQQAYCILQRLAKPYFFWVHILAPHLAYRPSPPYLHKFLPDDRMRSSHDYYTISAGSPKYPPRCQPLVDLARARYDEWMAEADAAFGAFLGRIIGDLDNTVLIVSADHGESFTGGFWTHGGEEQRRPIIHVPLIIHEPGQTKSARLETVTDHTSLAPTILDLVGLQIPSSMEGRSLKPFLGGRQNPDRRGFAFTEFFDENSAFEPLRKGTVGVVDGEYQYVLNARTMKGRLYRLSEADIQANDLSAAEPQKVEQLRRRIFSRFPDIAGGSS